MDIGTMLECGAAMGRLVRTASGAFKIEDAYVLDDLRNMKAFKKKYNDFVVPVWKLLIYPQVKVSSNAWKLASNGTPFDIQYLTADLPEYPDGSNFWVNYGKKTIGLFKLSENMLRPEVMV